MRFSLRTTFAIAFVAASITAATGASPQMIIDEALSRQDFAAARAALVGLPEDSRDFFEVFVDSVELIAQGDCATATPRLEALGVAQPSFMPAHRLLYLCDMARKDTKSAALRLDVMLALQPEGPARDQTLTLRRNLAFANGPVFSLFGDIIPSSNVGRQTAAADINGWVIPDSNRASKGARLRAGANATFGLFSSGAWTTTGVVGGEIETDTVTKQIVPRVTLELPTTFQSGNALFGAGPRLALKFVKGELAETQIGGKAFASWQFGQGVNLRVDGEVYRSVHQSDTHLDANHMSASVAYTHPLTSEIAITTRLAVDFNLYDQERLRRHSVELGAVLDYAAPNGLLLSTGLTLGRRWHNQPPPMSSGDNQVDSFASASASIGHSNLRFGPITPMLQYTYNKQWSDNVFYQYDSHDVGIRLRANL